MYCRNVKMKTTGKDQAQAISKAYENYYENEQNLELPGQNSEKNPTFEKSNSPERPIKQYPV